MIVTSLLSCSGELHCTRDQYLCFTEVLIAYYVHVLIALNQIIMSFLNIWLKKFASWKPEMLNDRSTIWTRQFRQSPTLYAKDYATVWY